jgi:hypothetical protein
MQFHPPVRDHDAMDPTPAPYMIRIKGHLGATVLSAFPAMAPRWHGGHTVLTGLLDRSALYGVLAEIEALGLDLLESASSPRTAHLRNPDTAAQRDGRYLPSLVLGHAPAARESTLTGCMSTSAASRLLSLCHALLLRPWAAGARREGDRDQRGKVLRPSAYRELPLRGSGSG